MKRIKTYVVVGFLGSGKTTFLKNISKELSNFKVAVVINEFGEKNIDGLALLNSFENLSEVNGGSIFCSCKTDRFIDVVTELSQYDFDYIFIEGSGLANPSNIYKVIDIIKEKTGHKIDFKGVIGVVDSTTIHKTVETLNAIANQLVFSDIILLNKTDLSDEITRNEAKNIIRKFNVEAPIFETRYSQIDFQKIIELDFIDHRKTVISKFDLNARSITRSLPKINLETLESFCESISTFVSRIKGVINIDKICYHFEYVENELVLSEISRPTENYIVILSISNVDIEKIANEKIDTI